MLCDQCFPVRTVGRASYYPAIKLTDRREEAFLAKFSRHSILVRAAWATSLRASRRYGAVQTFKDERERDREFARQWDETLLTAEAEIYRRAQEGVDEPIYDGKYREKLVSNVRKYSDRLLKLRARRCSPPIGRRRVSPSTSAAIG
tara:strand:+ start:1905 stop:2342 length:438 start_codon:yes stop_codon:yes gene_type:complete